MDFRTFFRWLFNPWVVAGAILVAFLLLGGLISLMWFTRPGPIPPARTTAVLNVIPAGTATATQPAALPEATPTPGEPTPPAPAPGEIALGALVEISGTGGDGLRLRAEPGLQNEVRLLGSESEVFSVTDGPIESDGYTWWLLVSPSEAARTGWAVSNFLAVIQNP